VGFGVAYLSELGKFDGLKGEIGDEHGSHAFFVQKSLCEVFISGVYCNNLNHINIITVLNLKNYEQKNSLVYWIFDSCSNILLGNINIVFINDAFYAII